MSKVKSLNSDDPAIPSVQKRLSSIFQPLQAAANRFVWTKKGFSVLLANYMWKLPKATSQLCTDRASAAADKFTVYLSHSRARGVCATWATATAGQPTLHSSCTSPRRIRRARSVARTTTTTTIIQSSVWAGLGQASLAKWILVKSNSS